MNNVTLIGNLTRDPELASTQSGIAYCRFTVAVSRRFKKDETDFINVIVWKKVAEICDKYLSKGSKVGICGRIQTGSYEKDGQKRYSFNVVADEVEFLTSKGSKASNNYSVPEPPERQPHISEMQPVDEELPF